MKTLSCLKNFGSFTCLLVSSGVSIWTWHYVTSPKTVGEIYERDGRVLRTMDEINNSQEMNYSDEFVKIKKAWFHSYCSFLSFRKSDSELGKYLNFYKNICLKEQ